jgi:hypothetical protein
MISVQRTFSSDYSTEFFNNPAGFLAVIPGFLGLWVLILDLQVRIDRTIGWSYRLHHLASGLGA